MKKRLSKDTKIVICGIIILLALVFIFNSSMTGQPIFSFKTSGCKTNAECGTSGWVGTPTCSGNNVIQQYRTAICKKGTFSNKCQVTTSSRVKMTCPSNMRCSNGVCVTSTPPKCPILKSSKGKINFLVIPNRGISKEDIQNGIFSKLINELFFGKADAYYYNKDDSYPPSTKPAPGFFDISPLNEFKDLVNIYYFNQKTNLDCPSLPCIADVNLIRDTCIKEIGKVDRTIVLERGSTRLDMEFDTNTWFSNHRTSPYFVSDTIGFISIFEAGRIAAHEFGHTIGLGHPLSTPLDIFIIPPVSDVLLKSIQIPNIPINCDNFLCSKWCKEIDKDSPCLKDFQTFLNNIKEQCGLNPTLDCEKKEWNSFYKTYNRFPIDSYCNIGVDCENGRGCYLTNCNNVPFLASSNKPGESVMEAGKFSFSNYESELIRNALNSINN